MNGEHIRKRLNDQPIPLAEVARRMDLSPQSLENRLKAKEVKIKFVVDLAQAINKNVYFLIKGSSIEKAFFTSDRSNTDTKISQNEFSIEDMLSILLNERIEEHLSLKLRQINQKLEYFECFAEAIKMKFEIDEELNKTLSSLKKTES
jgi:DNA-binding Lrp family transcriptional regulator